ncbi:MAG: hypothetical protein FJZ43_02195 [Candidatus Staskawiczbacteria bacterium]|nr:hypothetical protein [Candidatus Staskawiczbacteria bacterium]
MAQFGFVFSLPHPSEEEMTNIEAYFQKGFEAVEPFLVNGLRFASKQEYIGTACIVGPEDECQKLKQLIEERGLGEMIPNTDCIRPA